MSARPVVVLAGGVGAARFLRGLVRVVPPEEIIVIGNTGDERATRLEAHVRRRALEDLGGDDGRALAHLGGRARDGGAGVDHHAAAARHAVAAQPAGHRQRHAPYQGRPAPGPKARWLARGFAALGGALRRLWGSPPVVEDDAECNELEPERRLRALWTEVMSERERALRQAAETCRAELEGKLADLRVQLQAATERADQLEQHTHAAQFSAGTNHESQRS